MASAAPLRKRLPLFCLHRDASGKPDHLDCPLTNAEADLCAAHALVAQSEIRERETLGDLIARRKGLVPLWPQ